MKKFLRKNFGRNILIIVFPLLLLFFSQHIYQFKTNLDYYLAAIIFYMMLLISVVYFIAFQTEYIYDFIKKKDSKLKFVLRTVFYIISFSLTFSGYYLSIYLFDNNNFINVTSGNFVEVYFDFFFYSIGVFLINNNSSILANTFFAKLITITEILSSFISIIIILGNFKALRNLINDS